MRAHRPKAGFWVRLCVVVLYPLSYSFFRIRWHHLDRIPEHGGVLLAVNHISQADPAAMAVLVWQSGRIPRFLIKSGVFRWPIIGRVMSGAGQIPVYRGQANSDDALRDAVTALRSGECVIIYPEGTITREPDYRPMAGRTGVARIALAAPEIPVLPIGQWGAHRTLGRRARFRPIPRHRHEARIGEPVDLTNYRDTEPSAEVLRAVTDQIMAAITAEVDALRLEF